MQVARDAQYTLSAVRVGHILASFGRETRWLMLPYFLSILSDAVLFCIIRWDTKWVMPFFQIHWVLHEMSFYVVRLDTTWNDLTPRGKCMRHLAICYSWSFHKAPGIWIHKHGSSALSSPQANSPICLHQWHMCCCWGSLITRMKIVYCACVLCTLRGPWRMERVSWKFKEENAISISLVEIVAT